MVVFDLLQQSADNNVVASLDEGAYADADLVEVKVAYRLPYAIDQTEYERVNGTINIEGEHYNYVKKKLSRDTLYMLCIPNRQSTAVNNARHLYGSLVNDVGNTGKKESGSQQVLQLFFAAYTKTSVDYYLQTPAATVSVPFHFMPVNLPLGFGTAFYQPPRCA